MSSLAKHTIYIILALAALVIILRMLGEAFVWESNHSTQLRNQCIEQTNNPAYCWEKIRY